jgi:hypothetical protein
MKKYKLTFTEIDTKQPLNNINKKITYQYTITDKQLKELDLELRDDYINYIKTKLLKETAKAMKIKF